MATANVSDTTAKKAAGTRFKVAKVAFSDSADPDEPSAQQDNDGNAINSDVNDNSEKPDRAELRVDVNLRNRLESESSQPTSPYSGDTHTHTYSDTHNLKTFGHNTHEALPHADHYRNLLSATHALRTRPTLEELHGDPDDDESEDVENGGLKEGETKVETQTTGVPRFGWIKGVLIRCLLNIWGVMLFIRLSWIVGQAGLPMATLIILVSAVVTLITAMSMSAICTNGVVRGGGVYFMISRSLGPEFGGAIGIIFALANAVAVAMYVVGFAETVRDVMHAHGAVMVDPLNDLRIVGVLTLGLVLVVAVLGLEWVVRAQIGLLVILIIALIDFFVGTLIPPSDEKLSKGFHGYQGWVFMENMKPDYSEGESFFSVFAVFFPAATGILAGANISGDLANAQTAIPKGTFLAILISSIVYLLMAWSSGAVAVRHAAGPAAALLAANFTADPIATTSTLTFAVENATMSDAMLDIFEAAEVCRVARNCTYGLLHSYQMMEMISGFGPLITAGIFAATLSSALASLVGAPKVFQAVCADRIFPGIYLFAKGYGKGNEPIRAYALTAFIALCFIAIGELNVIALFISNIFLMAYALINYSCFDASLAKSPGWRPAFKYYSMWMSLFGSLLCLGIMFVIKWWVALLTFLLVSVLYVCVHYRKPDINWGSSTQAHVYRSALQSSLKLASVLDHIKNYRPQILVLSGFPSHRPALVDFANNITKSQSLLVCGHVIVQPDTQASFGRAISQNVKRAYSVLRKRKIKAFYTTITAVNFRFGAQSLMQSVGVGKLRPNTLLMGFKTDWERDDFESVSEYVNVIHDAFDLRYGVGILRVSDGFCVDTVDSSDDDDDTSDNENYMIDSMDVLEDDDGDENREEAIPLSPIKDRDEERMASASAAGRRKSRTVRENLDLFSIKQKKGTIDVWWLFDDGGLTILLPYILSTKSQWSNTKLRVFSAGTKKHQLDHDQRHMATLLSKFRIDYSSVTVLPDVGRKPRPQTSEAFNRLVDKWRLDEEAGETAETHPEKISEADLRTLKDKTNRHLRLKELLLENSSEASLIVMTLPMARKSTVPVYLYLAWLETLSSDLPPILLLRGNQQSVLTYYS